MRSSERTILITVLLAFQCVSLLVHDAPRKSPEKPRGGHRIAGAVPKDHAVVCYVHALGLYRYEWC